MNKLGNIEVLRCYAIFSLVAWHSLCVYVGWITCFPDIEAAVGGGGITKLYALLTTIVFIPDANMPLFTAISGFVYAYLYYQKNKYRDFKDFLRNKCKRLLIPYFIIGTIVVFTIFDWEPRTILTGDAHHLWYCAMLFWCFMFVRLFQKCPPVLKCIIVVACLYIQLFPPSLDVLGIVKGMRYFPYFIMGYYLSLCSQVIRRNSKWLRPTSIIVWLISIGLRLYVGHLTIILCYTFTFMVFMVVPDTIKAGKFVATISRYSFGVYVFHEWFLWNLAHIDATHPFIIEHQILYPVLVFFVFFSCSVLLTYYSLKTRLGRFLLGG